jgi:hypothetical protein
MILLPWDLYNVTFMDEDIQFFNLVIFAALAFQKDEWIHPEGLMNHLKKFIIIFR